MITITVSAQVVRSAMQCEAGNKETRYMLHGVLFAANGDVVATNGHILFRCPNGFKPPIGWPDTVLCFLSAPIVRATELVIHAPNGSTPGVATPDHGTIINVLLVDGQYPKYTQLIKPGLYTSPVNSICLQSDYLTKISKIYPGCLVLFHHGSKEDGPIKIVPMGVLSATDDKAVSAYDALRGSLMLIMPCNYDESLLDALL